MIRIEPRESFDSSEQRNIYVLKIEAYAAVAKLAMAIHAADEYSMGKPADIEESIGEAAAMVCDEALLDGFAVVRLEHGDE